MSDKDTIYRQDAIDALEESRRLNHHQDGKAACAHEYEHRHFLKILMALPSADPEAAIVKVLKMVEECKEKTGTDEILIMPKNGMVAWDENGVKYAMQPERKTGKWILMSDSDGKYYVCSICGNELQRYSTEPPTWEKPYPHKQSIDKTDFCSNCGCKMEG